MEGQGILYFFAISLLNKPKSAGFFTPLSFNSLIRISKISMDSNYAKYLLEETRKNYNRTAEDYTRTRAFIPEDLERLGEYTNKKEKVLDSGCASGRFYEVFGNKDIDFYGIDFSERLIEIAKKQYPKGKFQVVDALNLPFPEDYFDKVYSISVLHNIPSKELKIQYLREIKRVLKIEGFLILRVWDFWRRREGWELFLKYTFLKFLGKSKLDFFDVFVPWKNSEGKIIVQRYFHCFSKRGIINLIQEAGFQIKEVWCGGKDPRTNIYIVAEKIRD